MQDADKDPLLMREGLDEYRGEPDMAEALDTALIPEISAERQAAFEELASDKTYGLFCGDDRNATDKSVEALKDYDIDGESFLRYYGGFYGLVRVAAVSIAVQHGPEALAKLGDSLDDVAHDAKQRVESTSNIIVAAHSAEANEDNATDLNLDSEKSIGCAYCASIGAVCHLCTAGQTELIELAKSEQQALFGKDDLVSDVAAGNKVFAKQFLGEEPATFSLDRSDFREQKLPTMILSGSHAPAKDVVVVVNFHPDKVSNPSKANLASVPFYNNDVVAVAEAIIKAYPEYKLRPEILLAVMDHDIRATRQALAAGEGLGAADMKLERYGSPAEAIKYLESLQAA